jgi:hypothetical protein
MSSSLANLLVEPSLEELTEAQALINCVFDFHTSAEQGGGARNLLQSFKEQRRHRQQSDLCAAVAVAKAPPAIDFRPTPVESERNVVHQMFRGWLQSANDLLAGKLDKPMASTLARLTQSGEHQALIDSWWRRPSRMWSERAVPMS